MASGVQIKVPQRSGDSKVERALGNIKRDGNWHRLLEMGFTSAEQTARGYNSPDSPWVFGYTHETREGELISVLWAQWASLEDVR